MMSRAFRPTAAILAILLVSGVPTQAAPVAISEVIQVLGSYQNPPELRLRGVSQSVNSSLEEGDGPSPVASAAQESAAGEIGEIPDAIVGEQSLATPTTRCWLVLQLALTRRAALTWSIKATSKAPSATAVRSPCRVAAGPSGRCSSWQRFLSSSYTVATIAKRRQARQRLQAR